MSPTTSSSSSSSSFDEISVSEAAAAAAGLNNDQENEKNKKVVVEVVLPKEFFFDNNQSKAVEQELEAVAQDNNQKRNAEPHERDASSTASSFVPVSRMGAMGIGKEEEEDKKEEDPDKKEEPPETANVPNTKEAPIPSSFRGIPLRSSSFSSWASSSTTTTTGGWTLPSSSSHPTPTQKATNSNNSCASSVISGFDCLDIGGYTMKKCHLDGYLNETDAVICEGCGAALVANPCVDVDHQIALHLQQTEEATSLAELREHERKRKRLPHEPLWVQAQTLACEVADHLALSWGKPSGYQAVPPADLTLLAGPFLDQVRERAIPNEPLCYLAYTFTSKDSHQVQAIYRHGLSFQHHRGQHDQHLVRVLDSPQEAFQYRVEYDLPYERAQPLFAIGEEDDEDDGDSDKDDRSNDDKDDAPVRPVCAYAAPDPEFCVGWIVAVAAGSAPDQHTVSLPLKRSGNSNETYTLTTLRNSPHATLPLVCFDASLRNKDLTVQLAKGLQRAVLDVLHDILHEDSNNNNNNNGTNGGGTAFQIPQMHQQEQQPPQEPLQEPKRARVVAFEHGTENARARQNETLTVALAGYDTRTCSVCQQVIVKELACTWGCEASTNNNRNSNSNNEQQQQGENDNNNTDCHPEEQAFREHAWQAQLEPDKNELYQNNNGRETGVPLPPGWAEYRDNASGHMYYHNAQEGITTWQRPAMAAAPTENNHSSSFVHTQSGPCVKNFSNDKTQACYDKELRRWVFLGEGEPANGPDHGPSEVPAEDRKPCAEEDNHGSSEVPAEDKKPCAQESDQNQNTRIPPWLNQQFLEQFSGAGTETTEPDASLGQPTPTPSSTPLRRSASVDLLWVGSRRNSANTNF